MKQVSLPRILSELPPVVQDPRMSVFDRLRESTLFRSYRNIFEEVTGLPLELRSVNPDRIEPRCGGGRGSRFCRLLNGGGEKCRQCLQAHCSLDSRGERGVRTISCFAGLQESAVAVMQEGVIIAQLGTGQICHEPPTREKFSEFSGLLELDPETAEKLAVSYLETPVIDEQKYQAMLVLLAAFSLQLSELASQLIREIRQEKSDAISFAKDYIEENISDPIRLEEISAMLGMSPCYFCRRFKEATGMSLTAYVSGRRIALAQRILRETSRRVSEIAFEIGFQSLSQFNRNFRRITGQSPTAYRMQLMAA